MCYLPRVVTRQVKKCKNKNFKQFLHSQNTILWEKNSAVPLYMYGIKSEGEKEFIGKVDTSLKKDKREEEFARKVK